MTETYIRKSPDQSLKSLSIGLSKAFGLGSIGYVLINLWAIPLFAGVTFLTRDVVITNLVFAQIIATLIAGVTLFWAFTKYAGYSFDYMDISMPNKAQWKLIIGAAVGLFIMSIGISLTMKQLGINASSHSLLSYVESGQAETSLLLLLAPMSILFIAPGEEIIYRNIVQKYLYNHVTKIGSVIIASILFTVIHAPTYMAQAYIAGGSLVGGAASLVPILPLSAVLGYIYVTTRNLTVPILTHGIYNAIAFIQAYYVIAVV